MTGGPDQRRLDGRVAIVTGAGNGLGRIHALTLAAAGALVVVNDLGGKPQGDGASSDVAQAVVDEIVYAGGMAVANADSVAQGERIVECAMDRFGRVDILVNNAGILRDSAFHKMDDADWNLILAVHLGGSYRVTRAAWPHLRAQGYGRIVMTSSAAGIYGNFGQANYAAAKLGLVGLAQSLAVEGAGRGIMVNSIAPVAASRLTAGVMPQPLLDALQPELVTPLVLKLVSEDCDVSGQLFEVGGGCISRLRWERSEVVRFDPSSGYTVEDLEASWDVLQRFAGTDHPASIADSFAPITSNIGVQLALARQ